MSLPLFGDDEEMPPQAARLGPRLRALAGQGVYFGTSSWKYEGWLGSIYSPERYQTRGKLSKKKFDDGCLAEYAKTFPVVCGDFAFYQFPSPDYWKRLFEATPAEFLFAFKVPEDITVPRWPTHARYGIRAGKENEGFLRGDLFTTLFLRRLLPYRERVAALIFEFGTFSKSTFPTMSAFAGRLDSFLSSLPAGFRYSVEIRNPEYLVDDYFSMLRSHNTAHVFNAWTRMPELASQIEMPGTMTADFCVARALLTKHRSYEAAVSSFEPYEGIKEPNPSAREALERLGRASLERRKPAFLFVNNRLEGNAPSTIESVAQRLDF